MVSGNIEFPSSRVVIVEDDLAVRAALTFALEVDGFEVIGFDSAEALLNGPPPAYACLVIDYWLPGMNGLAMLARLRRAGQTVPAILITSNPSRPVRERAQDLGAMLVEKPLLDNAVVRAVSASWGAPPERA